MTGPCSIESEQAVIGGLMFDNGLYARCSAIVSADDFYDPVHQMIYQAIEGLILAGKQATPIIVDQYLKGSEAYKSINGQKYLKACCENVPALSSVRDYANVVRDSRARRDIKAIGEEIIARAQNIDIDDSPVKMIADAQDALNGCSRQDVNYREPEFIGKGGDDFLKDCLENDGKIAGLSTGLKQLDEVIGGLTPGTLTILAGRPSMGKTALALSMARGSIMSSVGTGELIGGHFSSMEMTRRELWPRMLSDCAFEGEAIPYKDISNGKLYRDQADLLRETNQGLKAMPLIVDDARARTAGQIAASARLSKKKLEARGARLGVIMVDYLTLMRMDRAFASNPDIAIGNNCKAMKELAGELECAVILLSQLNREVEKRDDKRPTMGDLRRSGEIEQDADVIGLVLRPEYYLERDPKAKDEEIADAKNVMNLFIDKNRQGPTTQVNLFCDIRCNAVRDARPTEDDMFSRAA